VPPGPGRGRSPFHWRGRVTRSSSTGWCPRAGHMWLANTQLLLGPTRAALLAAIFDDGEPITDDRALQAFATVSFEGCGLAHGTSAVVVKRCLRVCRSLPFSCIEVCLSLLRGRRCEC
jgi:hypothetical protein